MTLSGPFTLVVKNFRITQMKITQYLKLIFLPFFLIPQWCSRDQPSLDK